MCYFRSPPVLGELPSPLLPPPGQGDAKVTEEVVNLVHAAIEECLVQKKNLEETVRALVPHNVDSRLTRLVWERLEAENELFFKDYNKMLAERGK